MCAFEFPIRIYYEDTDAQGVVYYANYLKYLERARTEWLRKLGLTPAGLAKQQKLVFVVHRVEIDYLYPLTLDDLPSVTVDIERVSGAGFVLNQTIVCRGAMCSKAVVKIACLDAIKFKVIRIPGNLYQLLIKKQ